MNYFKKSLCFAILISSNVFGNTAINKQQGKLTQIDIFSAPKSGQSVFAAPWTTSSSKNKTNYGLLGKLKAQSVYLLPTTGSTPCLTSVKRSHDLKYDTSPTFMASLDQTRCAEHFKTYDLGLLSDIKPKFQRIPIERKTISNDVSSITNIIPKEWKQIEETCAGLKYRLDPVPRQINLGTSSELHLLEYKFVPNKDSELGPYFLYVVRGKWGETLINASSELKSAFTLNDAKYLHFSFRGISECNFSGVSVIKITPNGPKPVMFDDAGST
jgi:hypothetical protein